MLTNWRWLQGGSSRKPPRRAKGLSASGGGGSLGATLGRSGRDSLAPLGSDEPERPRSAGEWGGGGGGDAASPGGGVRGGSRGSVVPSRGGTAKSVELPPIGASVSGAREAGEGEEGLVGGGVAFEVELQSAVKLPEIR